MGLEKQGYTRVIADVTHKPELYHTTTPRVDHFKQLIKERCSYEVSFETPIWMSHFWIHRRLSEHYRKERVFLAGDAAHIHSPVGGQGMNIGIQDAHNLAWKLAYVIQGKAQEAILDTYQEERQPVAKNVLKNTTQMTKLISLKNPLAQIIRNCMLQLLGRFKQLRQKLIRELSEVNVAYSDNLLIHTHKHQSAFDKGIKAGQFACDTFLGDNKRLFDVIGQDTFAVLLFMGECPEDKDLEELQGIQQYIEQYHKGAVTVSWVGGEFTYLKESVHLIKDPNGAIHQDYDLKTAGACIIRPDKYIAFRDVLPCKDQLKRFLADFLRQ